MIIISKLIPAWFLPPGIFITLLLILVFFVQRKVKYFVVLTASLLYLLSSQPVSDLLLKPLENAFPPLSSNADPDWPQAIVILGGGTIQASPEATSPEAGQDTLTADALKRAVYGFSLRNTFDVPIVFSGGKVFEYNQEAEADTAGRLFVSLGLPPGQFIAEDNSRNTWENARETANLLINERVIDRAILVTSAYHMRRSVYCFENNGITVIPAPTDYKTHRSRRYDFLSFMPSITSLQNSCLAFHEYFGLVYYAIVYR